MVCRMFSYRSLLVLGFDLAVALVAWVGSFLIRFNLDWPDAYNHEIFYGAIVLLLIQAVACRWAGLYRGMWRFASLPDLQSVLKAVMVYVFGLLLMVVFTYPGYVIPRSMSVLYHVLLLMLMGGGRVALSMWKIGRGSSR